MAVPQVQHRAAQVGAITDISENVLLAGLRALRDVGATLAGIGLLAIALISPRGMGMGDVKLAALIGLVLGALGLRYVAVAAAAGVAIGGVASVIALVAAALLISTTIRLSAFSRRRELGIGHLHSSSCPA